MSRFNPTSTSIHPPYDEDDRGTALMAALRRNIGDQLTWDWPIVLALGLLTAGLLPLIILILRFQRFAASQIFQLEHLVEWYGSQGQTHDELAKATRKLQDSRALWRSDVIVVLGVALACMVVVVLYFRQAGLSPRSLFSLWTAYLPSSYALLYSVLLAMAYLHCSLALVHLAIRIANFVRRVNQVFIDAGLEPMHAPPRGAWPAVIWTAMGLGLLVAGCLWGLPMMLAAGAHRRYINQSSQAIRMQIAERIETLMQRERVSL